MSIADRVRHELREIGLATVFFLLWFLFFLVLKELVLAEYDIRVRVLGTAVFAALVVAKVVVVLGKTSAGKALRSGRLLLQVLWRAAVYTSVVFLVLLAERLFEAYRAKGELAEAARELWAARDLHHALAMALAIGLGFVVFLGAQEIDRRLGEGGLRRLLLSRGDDEAPASPRHPDRPSAAEGGL